MNDTIDEAKNGVGKKRISTDERIKKISEQIEKLKRQKEAIENREKEKVRKERTRRLIQNGALAEKYFDCEGISQADFETLLKKLVSLNGMKEILKER